MGKRRILFTLTVLFCHLALVRSINQPKRLKNSAKLKIGSVSRPLTPVREEPSQGDLSPISPKETVDLSSNVTDIIDKKIQKYIKYIETNGLHRPLQIRTFDVEESDVTSLENVASLENTAKSANRKKHLTLKEKVGLRINEDSDYVNTTVDEAWRMLFDKSKKDFDYVFNFVTDKVAPKIISELTAPNVEKTKLTQELSGIIKSERLALKSIRHTFAASNAKLMQSKRYSRIVDYLNAVQGIFAGEIKTQWDEMSRDQCSKLSSFLQPLINRTSSAREQASISSNRTERASSPKSPSVKKADESSSAKVSNNGQVETKSSTTADQVDDTEISSESTNGASISANQRTPSPDSQSIVADAVPSTRTPSPSNSSKNDRIADSKISSKPTTGASTSDASTINKRTSNQRTPSPASKSNGTKAVSPTPRTPSPTSNLRSDVFRSFAATRSATPQNTSANKAIEQIIRRNEILHAFESNSTAYLVMSDPAVRIISMRRDHVKLSINGDAFEGPKKTVGGLLNNHYKTQFETQSSNVFSVLEDEISLMFGKNKQEAELAMQEALERKRKNIEGIDGIATSSWTKLEAATFASTENFEKSLLKYVGDLNWNQLAYDTFEECKQLFQDVKKLRNGATQTIPKLTNAKLLKVTPENLIESIEKAVSSTNRKKISTSPAKRVLANVSARATEYLGYLESSQRVGVQSAQISKTAIESILKAAPNRIYRVYVEQQQQPNIDEALNALELDIEYEIIVNALRSRRTFSVKPQMTASVSSQIRGSSEIAASKTKSVERTLRVRERADGSIHLIPAKDIWLVFFEESKIAFKQQYTALYVTIRLSLSRATFLSAAENQWLNAELEQLSPDLLDEKILQWRTEMLDEKYAALSNRKLRLTVDSAFFDAIKTQYIAENDWSQFARDRFKELEMIYFDAYEPSYGICNDLANELRNALPDKRLIPQLQFIVHEKLDRFQYGKHEELKDKNKYLLELSQAHITGLIESQTGAVPTDLIASRYEEFLKTSNDSIFSEMTSITEEMSFYWTHSEGKISSSKKELVGYGRNVCTTAWRDIHSKIRWCLIAFERSIFLMAHAQSRNPESSTAIGQLFAEPIFSMPTFYKFPLNELEGILSKTYETEAEQVEAIKKCVLRTEETTDLTKQIVERSKALVSIRQLFDTGEITDVVLTNDDQAIIGNIIRAIEEKQAVLVAPVLESAQKKFLSEKNLIDYFQRVDAFVRYANQVSVEHNDTLCARFFD